MTYRIRLANADLADKLAFEAATDGKYDLAASLDEYAAELRAKAADGLVVRRDAILAHPHDSDGWSLYTTREVRLMHERGLLDAAQTNRLLREWCGEEMGA